jgi:predicted membrane protein
MWDEERQRRYQQRMERRAIHRAERLRYSGPRHAIMGAVLLVVGIVFLLTNLGVIYPEDVHIYWPVILVAFGVAHAVLARDNGRRLGGGIIAVAGMVLLARNLGYIHGDIWQLLWPVFLIFLGVSFLLRAIKGGGYPWGPGGASSGISDIPGVPPISSSGANVLNEFTVFSGVRRRVDSQEFEGGEVSAIFGGVEIDLRGAATKKDEVVIELNAIFGGVEMRVPDTWDVSVRGAGIFGGYEDKTMPRRDPASGKRPLLVVTGSAVFGGVTVM